MNFIKLFLYLSFVSATFVFKLSRSLAVKFNRRSGLDGEGHSDFGASFSLPRMPSIQNPFPVAHCDSLPKNLVIYEPENIKLEPMTAGWVDWKKYEKLLENKDVNQISYLYKNCAIDYNYMPKTENFYRILTGRGCRNCKNIMKGYFDSGVIDDMVEMGWLKYQDIVESALENDNYFVANLALDRLIEKHRPELKSPNYKTERPSILTGKYNQQNLIKALPEDPKNESKRKNFYFNCNHRNHYFPHFAEMFKFAKNFYLIFYNHPVEPWMADLRRRDISLMFVGCNL